MFVAFREGFLAKRKRSRNGTSAIRETFGPITRDHIPPEAMFGNPLPCDLLTFQACRKCEGVVFGGAKRKSVWWQVGCLGALAVRYVKQPFAKIQYQVVWPVERDNWR